MPKPICIDLFCGLGGWSEAFIAEGYECIGYDIEAHDYGTGGYPGELRLRDVRSIHGSEFKDAAVIVASPPCQEYSYMAMPWSLAKKKQAEVEADDTGVMRTHLTLLFNECFRLQREASEAAGHHIPMVVENVRGTQKWVGRAAWNYGSFYLWGDVPALMPMTLKATKVVDQANIRNGASHARHLTNQKEHDAVKVGGVKLSEVGFNVAAVRKMLHGDPNMTNAEGRQASHESGVKQHGSGREWFAGEGTIGRTTSSKSNQRKMASAMIAKIPFPLAQHIARVYKPIE